MLDDIVGHVGNSFVLGHGGVKVKVLYIHGHIFCARSADGAVYEKLDCKWVGGWCACVAWVVYSVVPHNQPCLIWFLYFFRSDEAGDWAIGHDLCSVLQYLVFLDEDDGVGASVAPQHSLSKASDLISI